MPIVDAFFVSKSENRNQVHYAVVVDASCSPSGDAPVTARWHMLEKGIGVEESLLDREQRAYGIASQSVLVRTQNGGKVRIVLKALPSRSIVIDTFVANGACVAVARTAIAGTDARLMGIHLVLRWPFGLDHMIVRGWSEEGWEIREIGKP